MIISSHLILRLLNWNIQDCFVEFFSEIKKRGILIIIGFVIFYVAFAIFYDARQFAEGVAKINYYLVIPILLSFTAGLLLKSMRQFLFLKHVKITIPIKQNIIIYVSGLSMLFTPGGLGEMIKSHFLKKKYNQPVSKTLPIVLVERYHDALAILSLLIIFSLATNSSFLVIPIVIISILLVVSIILVRRKQVMNSFQKLIQKIKILKTFENHSVDFSETLSSFSAKKIFFSGWAVGVAAWSFDSLGIYLCFQAFDLDFDFLISAVIGLSSILFGAMSLIPGGVGVTEISFVALLSAQRIDSSISSTLALFLRLLSIWYATLLGIIATRFALK